MKRHKFGTIGRSRYTIGRSWWTSTVFIAHIYIYSMYTCLYGSILIPVTMDDGSVAGLVQKWALIVHRSVTDPFGQTQHLPISIRPRHDLSGTTISADQLGWVEGCQSYGSRMAVRRVWALLGASRLGSCLRSKRWNRFPCSSQGNDSIRSGCSWPMFLRRDGIGEDSRNLPGFGGHSGNFLIWSCGPSSQTSAIVLLCLFGQP